MTPYTPQELAALKRALADTGVEDRCYFPAICILAIVVAAVVVGWIWFV
jgi:hypothetical protein